MGKFAFITFCFLSVQASYGDFCSQWSSVKACAELGCVWDDAGQVCRDSAPKPELAAPCEEVWSPEACDARFECQWDWDHCRSK
jgi:hypothetical protein